MGQIPWRNKWQPTPVFLPEGFHGQRSLEGYSPWVCKEPDTTEQLSLTLTQSIMLSEVNQTEKDKYYMISPICGLLKTNTTETGSQIQGTNWWLSERRGMEVWTK